MNVVIIEDEKPAARRLSRMLANLGIEVQTMLHSVEEAITWFYNNKHPDIILLDIQLSDGISFEIFEEISIKSAVIFTTAYDQYALKAFKLNSIDYLLKPIEQETLESAINKYKTVQGTKELVSLDMEALKKIFTPSEKKIRKRFTVKVGQHIYSILSKEIACIYSKDKATFIYTNKGRTYIIDQTLEQLESELNKEVFFRVNRSFYVNIDFIEDIISYTNSRLQIKITNYKEAEIIVSRERVKAFKKWLG